jgi:two-component system, OmpR family, phosphate regulon sensor histidine kinase PhoR
MKIEFVLVALLAAAVVILILRSIRRERRLLQEQIEDRQAYATKLGEIQRQSMVQAQAQQRALFDSMVDGVVLLDMDGRIQLANDALRDLLHLSDDVQGQTLIEAFRLPALATLAERLRTEKSVLGVELELPGPAARTMEVNASAIHDKEGRHRGAIIVVHDLTQLKRLEHTRQEFVANVSHELRTPLSLIKGFVETLRAGAMDEPEQAKQFLEIIQKHTDRLTYLIEDLLTISRLEGGKVTLNLQPVTLRDVAERVIESLRSKASEKEVRVDNLLPKHLSASADVDRLEQVLVNLVDNAIKYGRHQGEVRLGGSQKSRKEVELWVQDDGPGIAPESQVRIFERFYRVDRARSRETGGTGLGLAIVKHIVLAHGGSVWVNSKPGQGASFHFTLPAPDDGEQPGKPS